MDVLLLFYFACFVCVYSVFVYRLIIVMIEIIINWLGGGGDEEEVICWSMVVVVNGVSTKKIGVKKWRWSWFILFKTAFSSLLFHVWIHFEGSKTESQKYANTERKEPNQKLSMIDRQVEDEGVKSNWSWMTNQNQDANQGQRKRRKQRRVQMVVTVKKIKRKEETQRPSRWRWKCKGCERRAGSGVVVALVVTTTNMRRNAEDFQTNLFSCHPLLAARPYRLARQKSIT